MEHNNYVRVGNIIEQERLKRQAQIAKGVDSDVYDHIEKAHQDDLSKGVEMTDNLSRFANDVDNLNKAETEFLLSKLQRQIVADPESHLLKSFKSIAIEHLNDIEKAVYVDNSKNRKLGRVGQEYGGKKADSTQSMVNSSGQLNRNNPDAKRFIELDKKYDDKSTRKQMSHEEVSELLSLQKKFHAAQNEWVDKQHSVSKNHIGHSGNTDDGNGGRSKGKKEDGNAQKKKFIKKLESEGANKDTSRFMSKNESYFKDVLKKYGLKSFDDFEAWGEVGADGDWDTYDKIFMQCINKIPASNFVVKKAEDDDDIEKAVYEDTAENRKMGRVGQEYGGVGSRGGKGKTPQERQAAFKQKHAALVDKWKKEGNIAGLKKEIAAIKMEYGSDRQTAEKKIKPLEDAIAAAKSKKNINIKAED